MIIVGGSVVVVVVVEVVVLLVVVVVVEVVVVVVVVVVGVLRRGLINSSVPWLLVSFPVEILWHVVVAVYLCSDAICVG